MEKEKKAKEKKEVEPTPKTTGEVEVKKTEESTEAELAEILKKHTEELKEKEARKKEEEKKLRQVELQKRRDKGAHHEAKAKLIQKRKKPRHSKKYRALIEQVDRTKKYKIPEAILVIKEMSLVKFDASLDVHVHVNDQNVRGIINLPHGTGKKVNVAIVTEEIIEEIKNGKINFDILVASPKFMPQLAKVAKILGPKGLMPTPKSGTISDDPEKTKLELETGKMEYRSDKDFVVHASVGRISWPAEKLEGNLKAFINVLVSAKIKSAHIAPTMGPSLKLDVE